MSSLPTSFAGDDSVARSSLGVARSSLGDLTPDGEYFLCFYQKGDTLGAGLGSERILRRWHSTWDPNNRRTGFFPGLLLLIGRGGSGLGRQNSMNQGSVVSVSAMCLGSDRHSRPRGGVGSVCLEAARGG